MFLAKEISFTGMNKRVLRLIRVQEIASPVLRACTLYNEITAAYRKSISWLARAPFKSISARFIEAKYQQYQAGKEEYLSSVFGDDLLQEKEIRQPGLLIMLAQASDVGLSDEFVLSIFQRVRDTAHRGTLNNEPNKDWLFNFQTCLKHSIALAEFGLPLSDIQKMFGHNGRIELYRVPASLIESLLARIRFLHDRETPVATIMAVFRNIITHPVSPDAGLTITLDRFLATIKVPGVFKYDPSVLLKVFDPFEQQKMTRVMLGSYYAGDLLVVLPDLLKAVDFNCSVHSLMSVWRAGARVVAPNATHEAGLLSLDLLRKGFSVEQIESLWAALEVGHRYGGFDAETIVAFRININYFLAADTSRFSFSDFVLSCEHIVVKFNFFAKELLAIPEFARTLDRIGWEGRSRLLRQLDGFDYPGQVGLASRLFALYTRLVDAGCSIEEIVTWANVYDQKLDFTDRVVLHQLLNQLKAAPMHIRSTMPEQSVPDKTEELYSEPQAV